MESFLIYTSFYAPIKRFTDEQLGRLFRAIFQYKLREEPEVQDDIRVAFDFFKSQLDFDGEKYRQKVERNKKSGRLGGIAKSQNSRQTPQEQADATDLANVANAKNVANVANAKNVANATLCTIDNDNDNDNENHIEVLINCNSASRVVSSTEADDAIAAAKKKKVLETNVARDFQNYYNERIASQGARLVVCQKLTEKRTNAMLARIRDYGAEKVKATIDKAVASQFLNYGATNAPVNIDWIFRPNNFLKILEGCYDNKQNPETGRVAIDNSTDKFDKWHNGWT